MNVHKTFRICPGRLLNVLCTFNLRPVSTVYDIFSELVVKVVPDLKIPEFTGSRNVQEQSI